MLVFLIVDMDSVTAIAPAEGDGCVGECIEDVMPGDEFFGIPYDALRSAGSGEHTLADLQRLAAGLAVPPAESK